MAKRDYYEILGVSRTAQPDEIKAAYRREAIKHHPDKNPGNKQAEERFKELNEAYSILSDGDKRRTYDQFGHAGVEGAAAGAGGFRGGGNPFEGMGGLGDIFGDLFEEAFSGGGRTRRGGGGGQAGRDLRIDREVTLNDVVTGIDVTLDVPNLAACDI